MKFIHCSDIHLGRRPVGGVGAYSEKRFYDYFSAFQQIIEKALEYDVDAVLIAGDLFDRRELSPEILARTEILLDLLISRGVAIVAIEGNHDNISPGKEHESWLIYLEKKGLLQRPFYSISRDDENDELLYHFNPVKVCSSEFYGLGYPGGMVADVVAAFQKYLEENDKKDVVALIHTAPAGGDFLPGVVNPKDILPLQERVKYLACGHFHSYSTFPEDSPFLFIPGSSEYWDLGEKQGLKGMILFDTETGEHQFLETTPRKKITCSVETDSEKDLYLHISEILTSLDITADEDILMIDITDNQGVTVDTQKIQKIADEKCSPLRVEVLVKRASRNISEQSRRNEGESVTSVEKRIISTWDTFSQHDEAVHTTLNGLKENLRSNNQEQFRHSFDELLNHIIESDKSQCE